MVQTAQIKPEGGLLIYAPVPLFRFENALYAERQAMNGLRLWAQHFASVVVMMPLQHGTPPTGWLPIEEHSDTLERVRFEPLPTAYRPDQFARAYRRTRRKIGHLIAEAEYLSFAIGGLFGDWGAVAAFEAKRQNRRFAVWTDRVESEVVREDIHHPRLRTRLRARLTHRPMARLERRVVSMAALGLFHGKDTFDTYSPHSANPHLVHDIHIRPEDHIAEGELNRKISAVADGALQIVYAGRADAMKGPQEWLAVLDQLHRAGVAFRATWLGAGDELEDMRAQVADLGLSDRVFLPGFVAEHDQVLQALRQAHVFLFCHKTPESPRCLIEALSNGAPIVGYKSAYAEDLIAQHGGGRLVPLGDIAALTQAVRDLSQNRARLAELIRLARADGAPFTDEAVFEHRSTLIKEQLRP